MAVLAREEKGLEHLWFPGSSINLAIKIIRGPFIKYSLPIKRDNNNSYFTGLFED